MDSARLVELIETIEKKDTRLRCRWLSPDEFEPEYIFQRESYKVIFSKPCK